MNSLEKALAKAKLVKRKSAPSVAKRQVVPSKIDQPHLKALLSKQKKKPLPKTMEAYTDNVMLSKKKENKYITSHDKSLNPKKKKKEV